MGHRWKWVGLGPPRPTRSYATGFTDDFAALRPTESSVSLPLAAQNRRRERRHCAGRVRPHACGAALETSSKWTIAKVFSKVLSVCTVVGKKAAKRVWKLLNIVLKSRSCVWDAGADGSGWWILLRPAKSKERELVCGSVDSSWAHRTSSAKRVGRGEIFN